MKNGGLKQLMGDLLEEAMASSEVVSSLCTSIQTIAIEAKTIAETVHMLIERIDAHEKILIQLCSMTEKKSNDGIDLHVHVKSKETSKPN